MSPCRIVGKIEIDTQMPVEEVDLDALVASGKEAHAVRLEEEKQKKAAAEARRKGKEARLVRLEEEARQRRLRQEEAAAWAEAKRLAEAMAEAAQVAAFQADRAWRASETEADELRSELQALVRGVKEDPHDREVLYRAKAAQGELRLLLQGLPALEEEAQAAFEGVGSLGLSRGALLAREGEKAAKEAAEEAARKRRKASAKKGAEKKGARQGSYSERVRKAQGQARRPSGGRRRAAETLQSLEKKDTKSSKSTPKTGGAYTRKPGGAKKRGVKGHRRAKRA